MKTILKMKSWQEAATLILAVRRAQNSAVSPAISNYKLLWLKRNQKSSYMPGMYVCPGGVIDSADSTPKWHEIFGAHGLNNDSFASLVPKVPVLSEIYRSKENELPREICLRITAIRETFEESGILMCRRKDNDTPTNWAAHVSIPINELQMWRSKVHNDAKEFLALCKKLECYPDLWALHEWRNWLTPSNLSVGKRFNTMFYLACMPSKPYAEHEAIEIENLKWESPEDLFSMDIMIPPPQQYEIVQLNKFKSIDEVLENAVERNIEEALKLYLPVTVHLKDGTMLLMPGDTMYPKEDNLLDQQIDKSDITIDEYREMTPIKNRTEIRNTKIKIIVTDKHGKDNFAELSRPTTKDAFGYIKNKL